MTSLQVSNPKTEAVRKVCEERGLVYEDLSIREKFMISRELEPPERENLKLTFTPMDVQEALFDFCAKRGFSVEGDFNGVIEVEKSIASRGHSTPGAPVLIFHIQPTDT